MSEGDGVKGSQGQQDEGKTTTLFPGEVLYQSHSACLLDGGYYGAQQTAYSLLYSAIIDSLHAGLSPYGNTSQRSIYYLDENFLAPYRPDSPANHPLSVVSTP